MASSATRTATNRETLLEQVLAESPVRSSWFAKHFTGVSLGAQVALDFLSVIAAMAIVYAYSLLEPGRLSFPLNMLLLTSAIVSTGFVSMLERYGLYRPGSSLLHIRETEGILRSTLWT